MNKQDITLLLMLFIVILSILLLFNDNIVTYANIYYEDNIIKSVDLNVDNIYTINGYNGIIKIQVNNKRIRVIQEKSNRHLCSKQGYISKSYESIICLPNKISISLSNNELDGVVK